MTPADRLIARHHLGDRLHWIGRGGPHADLWIVQAWPDTGHMLSAQGATVDAAAADCAAQLRAAGWVPTHARLEWEPTGKGSVRLCLRLDKFTQVLFSMLRWGSGRVSVYDMHTGLEENRVMDETQAADAVAYMVGWCAAALPSLHLPPFPGDKP